MIDGPPRLSQNGRWDANCRENRNPDAGLIMGVVFQCEPVIDADACILVVVWSCRDDWRGEFIQFIHILYQGRDPLLHEARAKLFLDGWWYWKFGVVAAGKLIPQDSSRPRLQDGEFPLRFFRRCCLLSVGFVGRVRVDPASPDPDHRRVGFEGT